MKRRITRLPIVQVALVAVSVLVGLTLVPVAAQTAAGLDGMVTVRSDGAVYLIQSGMRRWVATVVITDDELNAYPEAEPIYTALAPFGGGTAASSGSTTAAKPGASTSSSSTPSSPGSSTAPASGSTTPASGSTSSGPTASTSTSAGPTPTVDAGAMVQPTGGACPSDHQVKGATTAGVKTYYEPDRPEYPNITPEVCFTAGSYARDAGYKQSKK